MCEYFFFFGNKFYYMWSILYLSGNALPEHNDIYRMSQAATLVLQGIIQ